MSIRPSEQFLRFLLVGGGAAAVNVLSRVVYNEWTGYSLSIVLAYGTGMVVAFLLARAYVFPGGRNSTGRSMAYFTLVNGVALMQTWGISLALADYVFPRLGVRHFAHGMAHMVGVAAPVFTSYVGHKEWSFR